MKKDIHPVLNQVSVQCACGNEFVTHSTKKELRVTLCSACHPFYTKTQKLVDTAGRIEQFNQRYGQAAVKGKK